MPVAFRKEIYSSRLSSIVELRRTGVLIDVSSGPQNEGKSWASVLKIRHSNDEPKFVTCYGLIYQKKMV